MNEKITFLAEITAQSCPMRIWKMELGIDILFKMIFALQLNIYYL